MDVYYEPNILREYFGTNLILNTDIKCEQETAEHDFGCRLFWNPLEGQVFPDLGG